MDQKQSNSISKVIGLVFIVFGICMLCLGIPLLFASNKGEIENILMLLFLAGGVLMFIGGIQSIKRANQKDIALEHYQNEINKKLHPPHANVNENLDSRTEAPLVLDTMENSSKNTVYKPDVLANWNYSKEEWQQMTSSETKRRFKEGIWVSALVAALGTWILYQSKGASLVMAFCFSLGFGIFLSWLKVQISNHLFRKAKQNSIVITSNALIINGRYKVFKDIDIQLEYVKSVKEGNLQFMEFSLQWLTRRGVTNDQIRILVPKAHENEIEGVVGYFGGKG